MLHVLSPTMLVIQQWLDISVSGADNGYFIPRTDTLPIALAALVSMRRPTLRSSRLAAVRWPGASAPRASHVRVAVWPARKGRDRLSERTLGRPNFELAGWLVSRNGC